LCFPRIQLTRYRVVGAGHGSWEAYACRAPARWLCHDLALIRPTLVGCVRNTCAERSQC
jgi:hypothetical protein